MFLTHYLLRHAVNGGEVWFNTLTGAVDRLSRREVEAAEWLTSGLERRPQDNLPADPLRQQLISRGYLYRDQSAERSAHQRLLSRYVDAAGGRAGRSLILCPTYACNLRCVYCFERQGRPRLPQVSMDRQIAQDALSAFSRIRSLDGDEDYSMGLFGGEPLLPGTEKVVSQALAAARAAALPMTIVTNGTHVPRFLPLVERYARTIRSVQLTIDGPPQVHDRRRPSAGGGGTFSAVAGAADLLLSRKIGVVLRVNIDRRNVGRLPQLARLAIERGWAENDACAIRLSPVKSHLDCGETEEIATEAQLLEALLDVYDGDPVSEELFGFRGFQSVAPVSALTGPGGSGAPRVFHCEANYGGYWVAGPDGYLYGCPEAIGRPELAIGRFTPGFELWQEQRRRWTGRSIATLPACRDCALGPVCGGGCVYSSLARYGDSRPACEADLRQAIGIFLRRRVLPRFH